MERDWVAREKAIEVQSSDSLKRWHSDCHQQTENRAGPGRAGARIFQAEGRARAKVVRLD